MSHRGPIPAPRASRACRFSKPALMLICSVTIVLCDIVFLHGEVFQPSRPTTPQAASFIEKTLQTLSVPGYTKMHPGRRSKRPKDDPFWTQFHDISIVYTWVNGSDPEFARKRLAHGKRGSESRYRDTEELLHSMRSLSLFAPWHTGMIYIVTPGDHPTWMDLSHPRLKIVNQETLIPAEVLPVFNSAVIEMNLYKIEGLTDIFIHMNDDYLIGRPLHPSDFVTDDGGVRLYHEKGTISGGLKEFRRNKAARTKLWLSSVYHTAGLLTEDFGKATRKFVKHAPFVYSKKVMIYMRKRWETHFKESQVERFRSHGDVLVPFAHHGFVKSTKMVPFSDHIGDDDQDAVLCIVKDDMNAPHKKMVDHIAHPHLYFTVNDGFKSATSAEWLRSFLHHILPEQSEFELQDRSPSANRTDIAAWSDDYNIMSIRAKRAATGTLEPEDRSGATKTTTTKKSKSAAGNCDYSCSGHGECTVAGCRCEPGYLGLFCDFEMNGSQKTYEIVPDCEGVDVVFTWVNGSDATLIDDIFKHTGVNSTTGRNRIRDLGQLRYGLRSVLLHAPWVRHVWVVSGTPKPDWLDGNDPRLSFVSHSEIFSSDELPQLNSNSIQHRLWRIPHLASRFLSMDDDFFFNLPISPELVLGPSLTSTVQFYRSQFKPSKLISGPYKDSIIHTNKVVQSFFNISIPDSDWYSVGHVPPVFDSLFLDEIDYHFQEEFSALAKTKTRTPLDLEPNYAYAFMLQGMSTHPRGVLQTLDKKSGQELLCRAAGRHPKRWSPNQKDTFSEKFDSACIRDILASPPSSPVPEHCQEKLFNEVSKIGSSYSRNSKAGGYFVMMTERMSFKALTKNLRSGSRRFICMNDDYGSRVPRKHIIKLIELMETILPNVAPWELHNNLPQILNDPEMLTIPNSTKDAP